MPGLLPTRINPSGPSLIAVVLVSSLLFYFLVPADYSAISWRPAAWGLVTGGLFAAWAGLTERKAYWQLIGMVIIFFLLFYYVVVWKDLEGHWQAAVGAFSFGALVGLSEIGSRYRDEPLKTIVSPYGLIYIVLNGAISLLALLLILHYPNVFPFAGDGSDKLKAAILAGFGATLIMRSKIAIVKTSDNKEIPVGPDLVIHLLLQMIDANVDRMRAAKRQAILKNNFDSIRALGSFKEAFPYLFNSLLAFQNLDDAFKQQLNNIYNSYLQADAPEDVKRLGLGFIFLTVVGESNFEAIVRRAVEIKAGGSPQSPTPPGGSSAAAPPPPASPPPGTP